MGERPADTGYILTTRTRTATSGVRVAVKDSIDIAGYPTRCGSAVLRDAPAAIANATVVDRLVDAGAQIVGKANMHEFAYGLTGINGWTGTPRNSLYPGLIPGGSSSGSAAAVAADLADIAIGTDTGGSIRVPAACCGVFGLKPSFGLVDRTGVIPAHTTLDCVGPFARDMATLIAAMTMIAPGFRPAPLPDGDGIVLGVLATRATPEVAEAIDGAIAASGVATRLVDLPSFADAYTAGLVLIAAETFAAVGHHLDHPAMGDDVRHRLRGAQQVTAEQVRAAEVVRDRFTAEVDAVLRQVDAIALPTLPIVPPTLAEAADAGAGLRLSELVRPFNLSGHPALTIPLQTATALPVGLQLVGASGGDAALCALASRLVATLSLHPERGHA